MRLLWFHEVVLVAVVLLLLRLWQVVVPRRIKASVSTYSSPWFHDPTALNRNQETTAKQRHVRVVAVLGSGGHTTELLKLIKRIKRQVYTPFTFVVAEMDTTSRKKTELDWKLRDTDSFVTIPRSREVGQSWVSSVWTTFRAFKSCLHLVYTCRPQLVLCNGPGTCIPVCVAVLLFRVVGVHTDSKIVFCESFARVQHLSLTGKLLYYVADEFVVQWPQLQLKYRRTKHLGVIC